MFDGDEMNVHSCGSTITEQEIKNIALVPTQIISPSKCKPIITIIQDPLVGAYLMTQDGVTIHKDKIENLMMKIKDFTGQIPSPDGKDDNGNDYWTGRNVYSMILPDVSLNLTNNSDETVTMKNGKYLSGSLDSSILGSRGLVHDIYNTYGMDRCKKFIDSTQSLLIRWMESQGFSVGIGDAVPISKEMKDKIEEIIDNKIEESKEKITLAYQGLYEPQLDNELRLESMDLLMKKIANDCANEVVKYIKKELSPDNRFKVMVNSGAKGKNLNIQQIIGIVGQQDIWGSRIQDGFNHRTLPHFHKYDFGLSAKGFVRNSFVKGLNPAEFFFSMMGGRTGMIDTAVKSVTGDTSIVITEGGKGKYTMIGDWIDEYMDKYKDKIEHYEARNLELLRVEDFDMYIPTCDEKGNVSWEQITALTRHDPGEELYKIRTQGGREVIVPESKSLLIWNHYKEIFEGQPTNCVDEGDYVPVTQFLPKHPVETKYINLEDYFTKR